MSNPFNENTLKKIIGIAIIVIAIVVLLMNYILLELIFNISFGYDLGIAIIMFSIEIYLFVKYGMD